MVMLKAILLSMMAAGGETAVRRVGRKVANFGNTRKRARKANRRTFTHRPKGQRKSNRYDTTTGRRLGSPRRRSVARGGRHRKPRYARRRR